MLQDEAFHFLRIGSFLERADNTARLLDVKFHAVESEYFGGATAATRGKDVEVDFYHWSAILRSVSGFEVYRKVYRNVIRPEQGRRAADPAPRHAALARRLHARGACRTCSRVANEQSTDTLRLRRPAATPTCSTAASTRSSRPGCTPT